MIPSLQKTRSSSEFWRPTSYLVYINWHNWNSVFWPHNLDLTVSSSVPRESQLQHLLIFDIQSKYQGPILIMKWFLFFTSNNTDLPSNPLHLHNADSITKPSHRWLCCRVLHLWAVCEFDSNYFLPNSTPPHTMFLGTCQVGIYCFSINIIMISNNILHSVADYFIVTYVQDINTASNLSLVLVNVLQIF